MILIIEEIFWECMIAYGLRMKCLIGYDWYYQQIDC